MNRFYERAGAERQTTPVEVRRRNETETFLRSAELVWFFSSGWTLVVGLWSVGECKFWPWCPRMETEILLSTLSHTHTNAGCLLVWATITFLFSLFISAFSCIEIIYRAVCSAYRDQAGFFSPFDLMRCVCLCVQACISHNRGHMRVFENVWE